LKTTQFLFWNEDKIWLLSELSEEMKATLVDEVGGVVVNFAQQTIVELLVLTWLCTSNGNAKKDIQSWAIVVNEQRVDNIGQRISETDRINNLILIRKGKKQMKFIIRG
jgi:tyrosyl-tRNA synthetase